MHPETQLLKKTWFLQYKHFIVLFIIYLSLTILLFYHPLGSIENRLDQELHNITSSMPLLIGTLVIIYDIKKNRDNSKKE